MAGGVANQAVACARLGLNTHMVTNVGTDLAGRFVAELLAAEDVQLDGCTFEGAQSVTVAQVIDGDRAFTTYGDGACPLPPAGSPAPAFFLASLDYLARADVRRWRRAGTIVVTDAAWDPTGRWDPAALDPLADADIFVPNEVEALALTGAADIHDAAARLLSRLPVVIVTRGADGVTVAVRGECEDTSAGIAGLPRDMVEGWEGTPVFTDLPAIRVTAKDTTGAGDAFTAGLVRGLSQGASLVDSVVFAQVTAAWTVERLGGSGATPTSEELLAWANAGALQWAATDPVSAPSPTEVVQRLICARA